MQFNLQLARQLAESSQTAYSQQSFGSTETDTQVLVQDLPDKTIIAFRGTSDWRDALTDAKIAMRQSPGGRVHTGIHDAVESILVPLSETLRAREGRLICFTGHSLGGAEAALAAYVMAKEKFTIAAIYTFGGLRFCDAGFRNNYNSLLGESTVRVVNQDDPVPHVPLPGIILPYRHVGHEVYLPLDGGTQIDRNLLTILVEDSGAMLEAYQEIRSGNLWFGNELLTAHSIAHYRDVLAKLA